MGPRRAREVIEALVQGTHPVSGVALPEEKVLESAGVLRALLVTAEALRTVELRLARRALLPANVGKRWTDQEDALVRQAFERKRSLEEIARAHGRTASAVAQRLLGLGLISADSPDWQGRFGTLPAGVLLKISKNIR